MTPLDQAHTEMVETGEDAARLRFYERLADGELFLLLDQEPEGETIAPRVFPLEDGPVVLVFDREERLAEFSGAPVPYAALPGRVVVRQLAGQGIGLGLNLGVAPSAFLITAEAVDWLAALLERAPAAVEARPERFVPPGNLPESLLRSLDQKLALAAGLAASAHLAGVIYDSGHRGHVLAIVGAAEGAQPALANAVGEALTFSGLDAGELDVVFLGSDDPVLGRLAPVALRFDLPLREEPERAQPAAPGSDPARPPILR
ncbi:SseB family protein [Tabrizicola sp. J26]|uniref:SseB family protein n=1 Tax=Alitabrizicola rongguiensis TaxID=2909234 RepID=UPI001F177BE1|nr:SseB family protein [Tabrizicola rongguiensis]MCF1709775.1 SseB family protein [Tabrizicola rongguiensis]